jgi:formate dehydrogenase maturation protein FdhE
MSSLDGGLVRETTQTGIPFIQCTACTGRRPETRRHCTNCGRASIFLDQHLNCLPCLRSEA